MLTGKFFLITGTVERAQRLEHAIIAAHGNALVFPTIIIEPLQATAFAVSPPIDLVIFTSQPAVIYGLPLLQTHLAQFPNQIAAIGPATAQLLTRLGVSPTLVASSPYTSEALLQLPVLQQLTSTRILLCQGEGGRSVLADQLTARGADVQMCWVYRRVCSEGSPKPVIKLLKQGRINAIIITSLEALLNLQQLLIAERNLLQSTRLVVVSERLRVYAEQQGYRVTVANDATDQAILTCLCQEDNFNDDA